MESNQSISGRTFNGESSHSNIGNSLEHARLSAMPVGSCNRFPTRSPDVRTDVTTPYLRALVCRMRVKNSPKR